MSLDGEILVDRGFLLAVGIGNNVHRVKALKIVGFSDPSYDRDALRICPLWKTFVRQAGHGRHQSDLPSDRSTNPVWR